MELLLVAALVVVAVIDWPVEATDFANRLDPPSGTHLLGTDQLGRDVLARVLGGVRWTVGLGAAAVLVSVVIGTAVGLATGWLDGTRARIVGTLVQSVVDLVVALPALLVGLLVAAVLGPGLAPAMIALVVMGWAPFARLAHRLTVTARTEEWVVAARSLGAGPVWILRVHVLPAITGPLREAFTARFVGAMLTLAGLSFLGLGVQPPTPEWGAMLAEGRTYAFVAPWLVAAPAAAVVLVSALAGRSRIR
ncbi:ABC transporter permease [Actinomycetospora termitidis]|uniref:ABC transporter permease n=1 Tax=Actinomycetospora termitidis TaxID=3053470 RepID=A0ABT7M8F9_9PSEU|nr:ABC transporter permease [Actinomycetospora sp. Odt1-22]MDL5156479.1 ABC transporter permease [Actinomycetospora sp. Odt1-22]